MYESLKRSEKNEKKNNQVLVIGRFYAIYASKIAIKLASFVFLFVIFQSARLWAKGVFYQS